MLIYVIRINCASHVYKIFIELYELSPQITFTALNAFRLRCNDGKIMQKEILRPRK